MIVKRWAALMLALSILGGTPVLAIETKENIDEAENVVLEETAEISVPFEEDIADKWFAGAAREAYQNGWMLAVDEARFDGDVAANRGEVVDAIWRMTGAPKAMISTGYIDVEADNPYHDAIDWAREKRIATGLGDGRFGWQEKVNREQLAVMLYRYAQLNGQGFSGTWMLLLDTDDREQVSDWAYESVCWLFMNKVMTGRGRNFAPQGSTTRGELAATLVRFADLSQQEKNGG